MIANYVVGIETKYDHTFFRGTFSTKEEIDFSISINNTDIEYEKKEILLNGGFCDESYGHLENAAILRELAGSILDFNVFLLHGAGIGIDNTSFLFTGTSGIGKTTHINYWISNVPNSYVINGDKPFIKFSSNGSSFPPLVCGSPWAGKENMYTNTMVPLKAIICMERAEENCIHEITFAEAFPFLLQQTYRPEDEDKMRKTLKLLQRLNNGMIKFYKFYCNNFKDDCFDVAYNALVGKSHE